MKANFAILATLMMNLSVSTVSALNKEETKGSRWSTAFESDSEFMKGFETGIYLRTKGGSIEDYGCSVPKDADNKFSVAIDEI